MNALHCSDNQKVYCDFFFFLRFKLKTKTYKPFVLYEVQGTGKVSGRLVFVGTTMTAVVQVIFNFTTN